MTTNPLLEVQKQLEDRWIVRAMANTFDGKGNYGVLNTYFSHRVQTKKELVALIKSRGWYGQKDTEKKEKIPAGTLGIAQRIYKKLQPEPKWEIYFPDKGCTVHLEESELENALEYKPYDADDFMNPINEAVDAQQYNVKQLDRSSHIDTGITYPYIRASVLSKNKGFKCTITREFNEKGYRVDYEMYTSKHSSREGTIDEAIARLKKHIAEYERISVKNGLTVDYNGEEDLHLVANAVGQLSTQNYGEWYVKGNKYIYVVTSQNKNLAEKNLGPDYGLPVIDVPGTNKVMYALMPTGWMGSYLHRGLLKGKRELKNK